MHAILHVMETAESLHCKWEIFVIVSLKHEKSLNINIDSELIFLGHLYQSICYIFLLMDNIFAQLERYIPWLFFRKLDLYSTYRYLVSFKPFKLQSR